MSQKHRIGSKFFYKTRAGSVICGINPRNSQNVWDLVKCKAKDQYT